MKHIVKQIIGLSLVLLLLVAFLPVGVSAAENDTATNDITADDTTTDDTTTDDTTIDDTTTEGDANTDAAPEEDFFAKLFAMFREFFAWFTEQVNKFFSLM